MATGASGACRACGAEGPAIDAPASGSAVWARVTSAFRCRECGQLTPVNGLLLDDVATCVHCDATQALDVRVWDEALAHAHAAADLGRPGAAGSLDLRGTPLEAFARGEVASRFERADAGLVNGVMRTRSIVLDAGPGHPVEEVGGGALEVRLGHGGRLDARNTRTGVLRAFVLPEGAKERYPALLAVVAPDQSLGDADAKLEATAAGIVTLRCPTCAAALDAGPGQHFVRCTYCSTACRIPSRTLRQLEGAAAKTEAYYVCFDGPSPMRRALEQAASRRAMAEAQAKQKFAEARQGALGVERAEELPRGPGARYVAAGLVVALVVAVGVLGYRGRIAEAIARGSGVKPGAAPLFAPAPEFPAPETPASSPAPPLVPAPVAPAPAAPFGIPLGGCGCEDPSGPRVELFLLPAGSGKPGSAPLVARIAGGAGVPLASASSGPAVGEGAIDGSLALEVRCTPDRVIVADGSTAGAWSRADGAPLWHARLGPRRGGRDATRSYDLRVACQSHTGGSDVVELRTSSGRVRRLRTSDGR